MLEGIPHKKEDPHEINKGVVLRMAKEIIGGAFEEVFLERPDITGDMFVLETLQKLFPTDEKMRNDPEIIEMTKKIIQEKMEAKGKGGDRNKNGIGKINPEDALLQAGAKRNAYLLGTKEEEND